MKRFLLLFVLLFSSFFGFAKEVFIGLGVDVPVLSETIHWTSTSYGSIDAYQRFKGNGIGLDAMLKIKNEKTKYLVTLEALVNSMKASDASGLDTEFLFGIGKSFGEGNTLDISGLVGFGSCILTDETNTKKDAYIFLNMLLGVEGMFTLKATDNLNFYVATDLLLGMGSALDSYSTYRTSYSITGDSEVFYFIPKAGVLLKL